MAPERSILAVVRKITRYYNNRSLSGAVVIRKGVVNKMNGYDRMMAVLEGKIPDKVPHFELDFQLTNEAFGKPKPDIKTYSDDKAGRKQFISDYLDICEKIIHRFGWSAIGIDGRFPDEEAVKAAKDRFGNDVAVCYIEWFGTFFMLGGAREMEELAIRLYEDQEGLKIDAQRMSDEAIERIGKRVEAGADFVIATYDYGYNNGPYISPEMFAEIDTPYLKKIVDAVHELNKKILLHSDGDLRLILDQIVSTGMDGYQSIDPQGNMDIAAVRKRYPHLILMGNIQCSLLQDTDEEKIRRSVRYAIESAKPGGRFIFSTSNIVFSGMPLRSYEVMLDEYEKLAYYKTDVT
jgi:uroporphyrinogen decarboxylase